MLGAVQSQLGVLQLGQIFVLGDVPDVPDLDLCCTTVESLTPDRTLAFLGVDRTVQSLTGRRTVDPLCECD